MHERTEGLGPYAPFPVTATATAAPTGKNLSTTSATTIVASTMAVTPASMTNIVSGMRLNISGGTGAAEDVLVLSTTATTFTATFANGHSGAYNIVSFKPQYFGRIVVNTAGGTNVVFTLYNGSPLLYNGGTGTGVAFAVVTTPVVAGQYFYDCYCSRGLFYTLAGTLAVSPATHYTLTMVDDNV